MKFISVVLVVSAVLGTAVAGPVASRGRTQCASYCRATDKFQYESGKTYIYDYETVVISRIHENSAEHAKLRMTAKAEFNVLAPCEIVLNLKDVRLEEADHLGTYPAEDLAEFAYALERYPTRFAFQDGLVESLCPAQGEETWALNVKRGVLSLFQNSMNDFEGNHIVSETDVGGICETRYEISSGIYSTTVTKTKDLMTCAGRHARFGGLESVSYGAGGNSINNLPILKSTHECSQRIRSNRLEKSECKEDHILAPFSAELEGSASATTTAIHSLTFSSEEVTVDAGFDVIGGQTSLLYQQDISGRQDGEVKHVLHLVAELETTTEAGVAADTPGVFSALIAYLKTLNVDSLKEAYNRIKASPRERKIFIDALALAGTGPSVGLMQDLIQAGRIDTEEANSWLTSLAFTSYPTDEMISAVAPLIEGNPSQQAMLGISAMTHRYCSRVPECINSMGVQNVLANIENHLGTACRVSNDKHHTFILVALKALGNIGLPLQNPDTLIDCFVSEENPTEIRVAALQAFRRLPCDISFVSPLSKLFADYNQDSELRINAYLSLMRCPSPILMDEVQNVLASEPVNQVGSFVWTHLTNLQETKDPSKQYFKDLLASDFLRNKFNTDARKFSRNFEGGYMLDDWNIGAQAESNIIFSTKSFIPRSANLNLTAHVFGETVNLLEIGGRVEGLEEVAETLFGKDGYWPREEISTVFESMRQKREISPEEIGKYQYDLPQELHGHAYAKVFGNDLLLTTFRNKQELAEQIKAFHPSSILQALATGDDIDVTKNIHFMDTELTIPLASGFPLHLAVNGTASLRLVAKGNIDFTQWMMAGKASATGQLRPSAAIQIHGLMSIGAGASKRTGMSLRGTVHTSSMIGGVFEIDGHKLVSAKIDAPWDKMEVLEVGSDVSLLRSGRPQQAIKREIESDAYETKESCTGNTLSRVAGVKVCSFVSHPKNANGPAMFLAGDNLLKITVEKTDDFKSYNFDYNYEIEQMGSGPVYTARVKIDTPDSRVDRHLSTHAILDVPSRMFKWNMQTPIARAGFEGNYVWEDRMKSANVSMQFNNQEIFSVAGQLRKSQQEEDTVYEPYFLFQMKNNRNFGPVRMGGRIESSSKKFNGKLNLEGLTSKPLTIKGTGAMKKNNRMKIEGTVDGPNVNINFHSTFKSDESVDSFVLGTKYSLGGKPHESFDFKGKISREKTGNLYQQSVLAAIQTSAKPEWDTEIQWALQTSPGHMENSVAATVLGYDWKVGQYWSAQMRNGLDFEVRLGLECPKLNLDLAGNAKAKFQDDILETEVSTKLSSDWEAKAKATITHIGQPFKISLKGDLNYPGKDFKIEADLFSGNQGTYSLELSSSWSPDGSLTAIGSYNDASTELTLDHRFNLVMRINQNDPIAFKAKVKAEGRHSSASGEIQFGGVSHSLGMNVATQGRFAHDISIKATGPEYNYGAEGKFNLHPQDLSARVDLDVGDKYLLDIKVASKEDEKSADVTFTWSPGTSIKLDGKMTPTSYSASLAYPGRTIAGDVTVTDDSTAISASWSPSEKISVIATYNIPANAETGNLGLDIRTPFRNYEHLLTKVDYSMVSNDLKATALVEHTGEPLVNIKLDGSKMYDGVKQSYSGDLSLGGKIMQSMELDTDGQFKIEFSPSGFDALLSGVWRNEHVSAKVTGIKDQGKLEGSLAIESGIADLKDFKASVEYEIRAVGVTGSIKVITNQATWMVTIGGDYDMSGEEKQVGAKIAIVTPIANYEELRLVLTGKKDVSRLDGQAEFHIPELTYAVEMHGNVEMTGNAKNINGKGLISGTSLPNIHLTLEHSYNIQKKEFQTKVETGGFLFHPVTLQASGRNTRNDIQGKAQVKILGTTAEGKFRAKRDGDKYHAGLMAEYEGTKVESEVNGKFRSWSSFEMKGMVATPWKYVPQTYFEASHNEEQGIQTTVKIEQVGATYSFQQDFTGRRDGWRSVIDVTTPWKVLEKFSSVNDHVIKPNGWQHEMEISKNTDKSNGKIVFTKSTSGMIEFQGLLSGSATPTIEVIGKLDIPKLNFQGSGRFQYKSVVYSFLTNGELNMPHGVLSIKLQRSGEPDIVDVNCNYFLAMPESQGALKVNIMGQAYLDGEMNAELGLMNSKADIKASIPNHKIELSAGHDLTGELSTAKITGAYNEKAITLEAEGQFELLKAQLKLDVQTPCEYWRLVSVNLDYNFEDALKKFTIAGAKNGEKKFDLGAKLDLGTENPGGNAEITLSGTWNEAFYFKIESTCKAAQEDKKYTFGVTYNKNSANLGIQYNGAEGAGKFVALVKTECPGYETMGLDAGLSGMKVLRDVKVWINGNLVQDAIEVKAETGETPLTGQLFIRLTTPKAIEISGEYDILSGTKTVKVKGIIDGELYEVDGQATLTEIDVDIKTPHTEMKHFKIRGQYDIEGPEKSAKILLHHNEHQSEIEGTLSGKSIMKSNAQLNIKTPFTSFEQLKGGIEYDLENADKTGKAFFDKNGQKSQIDAFGRLDIGQGELKIRTLTPIKDFEDVSIEGTFSNNERQKRAVFGAQANGKKIAGSVNMEPNSLTINSESPVKGYEKMHLNAGIDADSKYSFQANNGDKKTFASFAGHMNQANGNAHLVFKTPLFGGIDSEILGSYDATSELIKGQVSAKINDVQLELQGRLQPKLRGSISMSMETSINDLKTNEVSASWDLVSAKKSLQATIVTPQGTNSFFVNGEMTNGNLKAEISLPAAGFEDLKLDGRYKTENGHELVGSISHNGKLWEVVAMSHCQNRTACKVNVSLKTPKDVIGRVGGALSYELRNATLNGGLKMFYNEQSIDINMDGQYGSQIGYVNGKIETSFAGHEYISGKVNYEFPGKGDENFVTFRYTYNNEERQFEGRVLIDNGTFHLKGITPFQGFTKFEARVGVYNSSPSGKGSSLEAFFEKENLQAALHAKLNLESKKGMVSVNADIPMALVGEGKFLAQYDMTSGIDGSIELASGFYSGKGTVNLSKDKTRGTIKAVGLCPINKTIPELNLGLEYSMDAHSKAIKLSWTSDGRLQDYGVDLDMDVNASKGHFKVKLNAPGSGWWQYANADMTYAEDQVKGGWNVQARALNEKFNMDTNFGPEGHLVMEIPIEGYERISSEWNIQYGPKKSFSVKAQVGNSWNIDTSISITIRERSSFVLEGSLRTSALTHPVAINVDWDASKQRRGSIAVTAKWTPTPGTFAANWLLDAKSGFLNGNYQSPYGDAGTKDGSVRFSYNFSRKEATVDLNTQIGRKLQVELTAKAGDGQAGVHFATQSFVLGNLRADLSYNLNDKKKAIDGTLIFHGIKHSFAASLDADDSFKVDGQVSINMGGTATYEMKVVYDLKRESLQKVGHILLDMGDFGHFSTKALFEGRDRKAHGQLEMKSSHPALNDIAIEGNYDFQTYPSGNFLAQWSASGKLGASFALQNKSWRNVETFVKVEAPFSDLEILHINAAWNLEEPEKHGRVDFRLNQQSYEVASTVMDVDRAFTFSLNSNIPFTKEKSLIDASINVNKYENSITASFAHNEHNIKMNGQIAYNGPVKAAGNLQLSSTFGSTHEVNLVGRYDFSHQKKNSFRFEGAYNGESLSVSGMVNRGDDMKANFEIQTPFAILKSASIEGNLNLQERDGKFTAMYQRFQEPVKRLQISYRGSQDKRSHEVQIHSPVAGYEDLSTSVEVTDNEVNIGLKFGLGKEIRIQGQYETEHALSVNGTLSTPFDQYQKMAFTSYFVPTTNRDSAYGSASLAWNGQEASLNAHWQHPVNVQLNIRSPWEPLDNLSAKFRVGMQSTDINDEKSTIIDTQAEWNDDKWGFSSGLFSESGMKYRMQGRVNWGENTIALESTVIKRNQEYDVKFSLVTPFDKYEEFSFQVTFSMDSQNWSSSFLNGSLNVKSPFSGMKTINARIMGRNNNNYIEAEFVGSVEGEEVSGNIAIGQKDTGSYKVKVESVVPVNGKASRTTLYGAFKVNDNWTEGSMDLRGALNEKSGEHATKATYKIVGGGTDIELGLDSSFLGGNPITFALGHQSEQAGRMDANIKAQIGTEKYMADLAWAITSNSIFIKASDNAISKVMLGKPTELELQAAMYSRGSADASVKLTLDGKAHSVAGKYQFDNQNMHAEGKLDSPKLDTTKAFRFDANYNGPEGLDVQAVVSGQKSYAAGFSYSSKQGTFGVKSNGFIDIPESSRAQFDFALDKRSVELLVKAPGAIHEIKGSIDIPEGSNRAEVILDVSSPLVSTGAVHLAASLRKTARTLGLNFECILDGTINSASSEFEYFNEQFSGFINLQVPKYRIDGQIFKISVSHNDAMEGEVEARIFGRHRAHASINGVQKGEISIFSSTLETESVRISYKLNNLAGDDATNGYFIKGDGSLSVMIGDEEFAIAYNSNSQSFNDMGGNISLRTPWEALKSAELSGKIRTTEGFMLDVDFKSSSDVFPAAGLSAKVQWEADVVDASFRLNTPVREYESIGLLVNVPRQPSKKSRRFEPRLSFTMPNSHYSFKGSFKNTEDKANAEVEITWPENSSRVSVYLKKISPYGFRADITTPFTGYERISFNGDLNLGFPQDGHAFASLKINEKQTYEGTVALKIQPGIYKMVVDVNTPLEKHNYGVTLRLEKTSRKTIHVEFEYPGSTIGLEFDYVFSGPEQLVAKASIKTPYAGYEEVTFSLVHHIQEAGYTGELGGTLGTKQVLVSIHGALKEESGEGSLKFSALDHLFEVAGYGKSLGTHMSAQLQAQSSWDQLKNLKLAYTFADETEASGDIMYSAVAEHNGKTLFSFTRAGNAGKTNEVELITPWRTAFAKCVFDWGADKGTAQGEFSWDMHRRKESTVAATLNMQSTSFGKEAYLEISTPTRTVSLQGDYALTALKIQHSLQYSWNTGSSIGYKILLKNDSDYTQTGYSADIDLALPEFPVNLSGVFKNVGDDVTCHGQLKYRETVAKFSSEYKTQGSWNSQTKVFNIFLSQPLADSPISLQSEFGQVEGVTTLKAKFESSSDRSSDLRFEWTDDKSYKIAGLGSDTIRPRSIVVVLSHPTSDLDIQLRTKFGSSDNEIAGEVKASYLDRSKNTRSLQWDGRFVPAEKKVITNIELDSEKMGIEGKVGFENGFQSTLQTRRGLRTPLIHSLNINTLRPLAEMKMDYGPSRALNFALGMPSDREASLSLERSTYGNEVSDALLMAKLNTSHIFHSKITWRPKFWTEALEEVQYRLGYLKQELSLAFGDLGTFWMGELEHRFEGIPEGIQYQVGRISKGLTQEIKYVDHYYKSLKTQVQEMVDSNSFFLRDITAVMEYFGGHVSNVLGYSAESLQEILVDFGKFTSEIVIRMKDGAVYVIKTTGRGMDAISEVFKKGYIHGEKVFMYVVKNWDELSNHAEQFVSKKFKAFDAALQKQIGMLLGSYRQTLKDLYTLASGFAQWMQEYAATVQDFAIAYQKAVANHPNLAKAVQFYKDYASWLEEWHISEYAVQFKNQVVDMLEKMMIEVDKWTKDYNDYLLIAKDAAQGQYSELKKVPLVGYFTELGLRVHESLQWAWKYYELEGMVQENLQAIITVAQKQTHEAFVELTTGHPAPWDFKNNYVWEPEHGRIEITQRHPFKWDSFKQWPQMDEELVEKLNRAFSKFDMNNQWHKFLDTVTTSKEKMLNMAAIIPPFNAYAIISGNQHFVTFDKRSFEFSGDCSYTLLDDPKDKFSITINFRPNDAGIPQRESLTVNQNEKKIEISRDYKVTLNSKNIDLPWKSGGMTIWRESGSVFLDNGEGIELMCLVTWDACTVKMTGWHFGRTFGLLGTFNNEPHDDFTGSDGVAYQDLNKFAETWRRDRNCMTKNYATAVASTQVSGSAKATCDKLFSSHDSALSPCFQKLDPSLFVPMCYNDMETMKNQPHAQEGACVSAAAYVSACRAEGMDIWMPPQCVKCELEDKSIIMAAETVKYEGNAPKATDVIIAVDHSGCVNSEKVAGIVHNLDAELAAAGSSDNRFTLVGFNGEAPFDKPHVRTSEGSIWAKAPSFKRAVEINGIGTAGLDVASIHDAVQYAARLPFRAGAGKSMILISCNQCQMEDTQTYSDSLNMLLERSIAFHYITHEPITLKGSKVNVSPWPIGYDTRSAYTLKDARKMVGDASLKDLIKIPKDLCVPLALETNGTVFSLEVFSSAPAAASNNAATKAKRFYSVVAKKVVETSKPPSCQRCDCVADHSGLGATHCQPCLPHNLNKFVQEYSRLHYDFQQAPHEEIHVHA